MIGTYGDNGPVTPDQVRHGLDDKQAYLWVGMYRMAVSTSASDDELHADLILADKIAASASFLAADIRGLLDKRAAERRDAENEAHEQHAEPQTPAEEANEAAEAMGILVPCMKAVQHVGHFWNDGVWCPGVPEPVDVLVAGDALADDAEVPCAEVEQTGHDAHAWMSDRTMHWCPGWAVPDLGEKEGAFGRFVETTAAEHKRAREAGEDR